MGARSQIGLDAIRWDMEAGTLSTTMTSGVSQDIALVLPPGMAVDNLTFNGISQAVSPQGAGKQGCKLTLSKGKPVLIEAKFHPETQKPNILHIHADDHRPDGLHALGNKVLKTPNLDTLVARGITFTRCYTMGSMVGAVCQPSRTMLLTGLSWRRIPKPNAGDHARTLPAVLSVEHLFPTFCDFAGAQAPPGVEGRSLRPIIEARQAKVRDALYTGYRGLPACHPRRPLEAHSLSACGQNAIFRLGRRPARAKGPRRQTQIRRHDQRVNRLAAKGNATLR